MESIKDSNWTERKFFTFADQISAPRAIDPTGPYVFRQDIYLANLALLDYPVLDGFNSGSGGCCE